MADLRCDGCRFWHQTTEIGTGMTDFAKGECHRHAPGATKGGFENKLLDLVSILAWRFANKDYPDSQFQVEEEVTEPSWWPATCAADWCGEHVALPGPKENPGE